MSEEPNDHSLTSALGGLTRFVDDILNGTANFPVDPRTSEALDRELAGEWKGPSWVMGKDGSTYFLYPDGRLFRQDRYGGFEQIAEASE